MKVSFGKIECPREKRERETDCICFSWWGQEKLMVSVVWMRVKCWFSAENLGRYWQQERSHDVVFSRSWKVNGRKRRNVIARWHGAACLGMSSQAWRLTPAILPASEAKSRRSQKSYTVYPQPNCLSLVVMHTDIFMTHLACLVWWLNQTCIFG